MEQTDSNEEFPTLELPLDLNSGQIPFEVISERDWQWCRFRKFFETTISARGWGGKIIRRVCHD